MKKRFLTLLAAIVLVLMLGTTFVILNIEQAISSLDDLVSRYEKDRKCARVLVAIKKVQHDGILHHTYGPATGLEMRERIDELGRITASCASCHHPPAMATRVAHFTRRAAVFQDVMSAIFQRLDDPNHEVFDLQAFALGQDLYEQAQELFTRSSEQLARETRAARFLAVKSKWLLYIITCSGLVVVIVTAFLLIRSFTRPLQGLLTATKKIEQGDLDYRVRGLQDEFGVLANAFNAMAASLKSQMLQLQRSEQLAACGKIAATLVHEVRNPLAGIKAAMEVLSGESTIAREDREILIKVVWEVNRIEGLFANMLEFARPRPPHLQEVSLKEIIDRALLFTPAVTSQKIKVEWDRQSPVPPLQADPNQLQQVFLNLFLNAGAAMPTGGTLSIAITVNEEAGMVEVAVADTGAGIDEAMIDEIFTPFFTTKPKGSGLGLATCKTLIGLHQGTIVAANRPEGGALFLLALPLTGGDHHAR
jgi:signal transduction histidine kinase